MAIHSCILAWKTPWTEKPDGLQSMGSVRAGHSWSDWTGTCEEKEDAALFPLLAPSLLCVHVPLPIYQQTDKVTVARAVFGVHVHVICWHHSPASPVVCLSRFSFVYNFMFSLELMIILFCICLAFSVRACVLSRVRLCDPLDCSPSGFSVQGVFQARIQEWIAISSSRGSSWPGDWTHVSCVSFTAGGFFTSESQGKPSILSEAPHFPSVSLSWRFCPKLSFTPVLSFLLGGKVAEAPR